ncbi:hypothetical protein T484DRAFT_1797845, partial [Baffinella frigidus]
VERERACITLTADGHVRIIDVPTRRVVSSWWGHSGAVGGAVLSPAGSEPVVITLGRDETLSFWDLAASTQHSADGACALALRAPRSTDLAGAVSRDLSATRAARLLADAAQKDWRDQID